MDVLQSWLVIGVPGLIVTGALFVGRSRVRAWIGYGVLGAVAWALASVPGGGPSAVVLAALAVGLVATGRGSFRDTQAGEHHTQRRRFTTAES
ncbi:MAG: hypothetical protein WD011_02755 [Nitriliruptoraceae bacterium]